MTGMNTMEIDAHNWDTVAPHFAALAAEDLTAHGAANGASAVELWTARHGPGRRLYESLGFRETPGPGEAFRGVIARTGYEPGEDEIRMRRDGG